MTVASHSNGTGDAAAGVLAPEAALFTDNDPALLGPCAVGGRPRRHPQSARYDLARPCGSASGCGTPAPPR